MNKKHPTVDDNSVTDVRASAYVADWLAGAWIVRPQKPDYHVDYIIESVVDGELSGAKFCAQQKGHREVAFSGPFYKEPLQAKHLLYYAEKERLPVFLLVVDTTARRGYFLFVQEWIDRHVPLEMLRERYERGGTWSVEVPQANDIENASAFSADVKRAFVYMERKNPGLVDDAIASDVQRMSAVDPRFDFTLDVVGGIKRYVIRPKGDVPVPLSFQITGAGVAQFSEMLGYGKPLKLSGDYVKVTGSPLFDEKQLEWLRIRPPATKADFFIWTEGADAFRHSMPVKISSGSAGVLFATDQPEVPFHVEVKIPDVAPGQIPSAGTLSIGWHFERWQGVDMAKLPYFGFMHAFSLSVIANKAIQHEIIVQGNRVNRGTLGKPSNEMPFMHAALVVEHVRKLRDISAKTGIRFNFPAIAQLNWEAFSAVELARALLIEGQYKGSGANFKTDAVIAIADNMNIPPDIFLLLLEQTAASDGYEFDVSGHDITVHGTPIPLGNVSYSVAPVTITVNEPSKTEFLAAKTRSVSVIICGQEGSVLTVKAAAPSSGT